MASENPTPEQEAASIAPVKIKATGRS